MIHLLWAVHNHQPVGNFDFVFERAHDRAYRPFLEVLKRHPGIRVSMHFSGILLDWLEKHRPEYLADVRALCDAGRLEILGGGYYEPILPMLTDADKEGQIVKLSRRIESLFGHIPRGMWLAERVWEPSLTAPIARCGIEYVVLDGSHFKMVGKTDEELRGYFETEDQGRSLKLIPIHDVVRDYIPFRSVEEVVSTLRHLNNAPRVQIVFGDDGEKFGDWPQTFHTVYTQGWLDRFFAAIEAEPETFAVEPLREGIDKGESQGLVYLPPASYGEMMVWAENPREIARLRALRNFLNEAGRGEDAGRFLHGTFWRNFLIKYPESNRIHKQALRLTQLLDRLTLPVADAVPARDHVWQAQCNCAYWHGVFGGLYLPHLRFGLYRNLIAAQKIADFGIPGKPAHTWERCDWNFDGKTEHLLNTAEVLMDFTARGSVDQFWLKRTGINLCDTLTRRREAYHEFVISGPTGGSKMEEQISAKEEGLGAFLIYDKRLRETFSEWLLPPGTSFDNYRRQDFSPVADIVFGEPVLKAGTKGLVIRFQGQALLPDSALEVEKIYTVVSGGKSVRVEWKLTARGGGIAFRFAAESLFCLLAGNAPDRFVRWEEGGETRREILASRGESAGVTRAEVVDEWLKVGAILEAPGADALWRDALETVSQSDEGYERVYQGTVLAPCWEVRLADGESRKIGLQVDFQEEQEHGQQGV